MSLLLLRLIFLLRLRSPIGWLASPRPRPPPTRSWLGPFVFALRLGDSVSWWVEYPILDLCSFRWFSFEENPCLSLEFGVFKVQDGPDGHRREVQGGRFASQRYIFMFFFSLNFFFFSFFQDFVLFSEILCCLGFRFLVIFFFLNLHFCCVEM